MIEVKNTGKSQMRSRNKVRVFEYILECGPVLRKDIEHELGISAPTVTRIIDSLMNDNLVCEIGTEDTSYGRKPIQIVVNKEVGMVIGISITKDLIRMTMTNILLEPKYSSQVALEEISSNRQLLAKICQVIDEGLRSTGIGSEELVGIGIASRGVVCRENGTINRGTFSGSEVTLIDVHVKDVIQDIYQCEVIVENNINTQVFKEHYLSHSSANSSSDNMLYLYFGEGVGAGIMINGELSSGHNHFAGNVGHMVVDPNGRRCVCGKNGHLEAYASVPGILESCSKVLGTMQRGMTLEQVCDLANEGDKDCKEVLDHVLEMVAVAIVNIRMVVDPGTIILCGTVFEIYEDALEKLIGKIKSRMFEEGYMSINWKIQSKKEVRFELSAATLVRREVTRIKK